MAGAYTGKGVSVFDLCILSLSRVQISAWAWFLSAGYGYGAKENILLIPGTSGMCLIYSDVNVSLELLTTSEYESLCYPESYLLQESTR